MPNPYQSFAKVFTSYHEQYAEAGPSSSQLDSPIRHDIVLAEEGGLIDGLMKTLEDSVRSQASSVGSDGAGDDQMSAEEREVLLLEHRTWQVIRAVYDNRIQRSDPSYQTASAQAQIKDDPYTSPEDITQIIVNEDPELSLYGTLVDHLQSRPLFTSPPPLEARHGYLPSTLRRAKTAKLNHQPLTPPSLDPDFTIRDPHGQGLAGEDLSYQTPLLETLWDLVRHGELDQAIKVCEQAGEPWRGASLMGGRRWTMGGMARDSIAGPLEGNRMRTLWKKSCRAIAKNATLSQAERNLYSALISDLPTLLPTCETWEDYLWAHVQSRMEDRIERRWHELGGFWEEESRLLGRDDEDGSSELSGGLDEVFADIGRVQKEEVLSATRNPYYVAQRMIILGRSDSLLKQFADRLGDLEDQVAPDLIGPLIRFFAHLILVLRTLGQSLPDAAANAIIQAYLQILEREGSDSLVAMYAACLREGSGEESYARFLRAMDPSVSKEMRMEALARAKQHNLDVAVIAKETVRLTLEEAFASIPSLSSDQPDIARFATGLSERDVHLIRSLEWLTILPETMDEALIKSNDVARYFLALGQAGAAQALLKTLPNGIATTDNDSDGDANFYELEHKQFHHLFGVFACHELVEEVLSRTPKATATRLEQHNWSKSLRSAIDRTHRATIDLATSDWLRFRVSSKTENGSQRRKELQRIRQIFIPDLILRLHNLLLSHRVHFPVLLQQALDLTKIVAAEEFHVYQEFLGRDDNPYRLIAYLERVREASLAALEGGSGSAFIASS